MKTITEYRPLIFGRMIIHAEARRLQFRDFRQDVLLTSSYALAGFALMLDLEASPLEWQFWMVFAPLFIACELTVRELRELRQRR